MLPPVPTLWISEVGQVEGQKLMLVGFCCLTGGRCTLVVVRAGCGYGNLFALKGIKSKGRGNDGRSWSSGRFS